MDAVVAAGISIIVRALLEWSQQQGMNDQEVETRFQSELKKFRERKAEDLPTI